MATTKRVAFGRSAVLVGSGRGGCGKHDAAPQGGMPPGMPVTAASAVSETVPVYIDEIGHTAPVTEAVTIVPQVSGKIVERRVQGRRPTAQGAGAVQASTPARSRPTLDQAQGQLTKDQATKTSADWNVGQDTARAVVQGHQRTADAQRHGHPRLGRRGDRRRPGGHRAGQAERGLRHRDQPHRRPGRGAAGGRRQRRQRRRADGRHHLLVINKIDPIYADFTVTEAELQRVQQLHGQGDAERAGADAGRPGDVSMAPPSTPTRRPPRA